MPIPALQVTITLMKWMSLIKLPSPHPWQQIPTISILRVSSSSQGLAPVSALPFSKEKAESGKVSLLLIDPVLQPCTLAQESRKSC